MFGNGSKNETVATASNGGLAIGKMGDGNTILQNPTFQATIQCPIPSNFFELCERGQKVDSKIDLQIDKIKELINLGQIKSALTKIQEIEEIWQGDLTNHHKFRIATNKGVIFAIQNDYRCAADKFIEAFNYEQNEITYANKILAYTLLNDDTKLKQTIIEAKEKFPNSKAITCQIIKAYINDSSVKDLHGIDDNIYTDAVCCLMASSFYIERHDLTNALLMAQKANEIKPNDWQIMANLGILLVYDIFSNKNSFSLLTDEQFKNLKYAQSLFEKSWMVIKNSEYPFDFISYIPINLFSIYSLQQDKKNADELAEILYDKLPNDPNIVFQKVIRNLDNITDEDLSKLQPQKYNDHAKVLADIYINRGNYNKALHNINLAPDKNDIFIITTHTYCLTKLHDDTEIKKLKRSYKDKAIKAIIDFTHTNNIDYLLDVKDIDMRNELKLYIAQSLYGNSRYRDAADVFQSVIKHKDLRDVFYRQYLDCLARTRQFFELKKQLTNFSIDSMDDWTLCLLGCTYDGMSDFEEAKKIFDTLYKTHQDNANHIFNLLFILTKLNDKAKIIDILSNINVDVYKLHGDIKYKYAIISYINDYIDPQKALEQIYLLTIHNMQDVEAWNQYFGFMIENHIERNGRTAYLLQDIVSQSVKYVFIDDDIELGTKYFDVISIKNPLAQVLLSHKQGDIIDVSSSAKVVINDINDKYISLLQVISKNMFLEFPTNTQIERISAESPEELLSYLQNISEVQKKQWSVCQDIYNRGFPVSLLAGMIKKDVISVLETQQLSCLNIAKGIPQEIDRAVKLCTPQDKYIIDAITLYNIFIFKIQNTLNPLKNKIYIAQSTKSKFISIIEKIKDSITSQASRLQTDTETGQMYMLTAEQLKSVANIELQLFDDILRWIQDNTITIRASYNAEFEDTQKKILSLCSEFDDEITEIVDIATEKNLILISDDLHLRDFLQTFDIRSIWVQALLKLQRVPDNIYNDFLKMAISKHHTFISLTADDLIYCLRHDSSEDLEEFKCFANRLGSSSSDSAARVIQKTLAYIHSKYLEYAKLYVYNIIINGYLQEGTSLDFAIRLKNLYLLGNMYHSFQEALYLWMQGHFVVFR